jgi:hypothetical protein
VATELRGSLPRFILRWSLLAEGQVAALPIIKHFEVFNDLLLGFLPCSVVTLMNQFPRQRAEEAFHADIIPKIPSTPHTSGHAHHAQLPLVRRSRILTTLFHAHPDRRESNGAGDTGLVALIENRLTMAHRSVLEELIRTKFDRETAVCRAAAGFGQRVKP